MQALPVGNGTVGAMVFGGAEPESAAFWEDVARTMGSKDAGSPAVSEVEQLSGSLADGLDPEETWDDVW